MKNHEKTPIQDKFNNVITKLILVMKLSTILLFAGVLQLSATVYSQGTKITLSMKDKSMKEVFSKIEENTDFRFFYNERFTDLNKEVSVEADNDNVETILTNLFASTDITYKVLENNLIVITPKLLMQQQTITGKVTDASTGEPLPGAYVVIQGTTTGTLSDADGNYSLEVSGDDAVLRFSSVGYEAQEVPVGSQTVINVQMITEITELSTIVVTGYSTEAKKDIIGSVAVVDMDEMLSTPSGNVGMQLQGRVAGVTISTNGTPGGSSKIRVRGFGSFSGSDPLYIIDGVPGSIDRLNPNDIESLQVLKDAASSSVYGARAANGVIIVTTKQGTSGATKLALDSYYGTNFVSKNDFPDLLNAREYGEMYWKAMKGAGRSYGDANWEHPQYGDGPEPVIPEYILVLLNGNPIGGAELENLRTTDPAQFSSLVDPANYDFANHQIVKAGDTDWFDEVFHPASIQSHNLTLTGGSDQGRFMMGFNYFNEKSMTSKYAYFTRYTLRANSSFDVLKRIRIGENLQVSLQDRNNAWAQNPYIWTPLIPVWDIAGKPAGAAAPGLMDAEDSNPIGVDWRHRFDGSKSWSIFGNAFIEADILQDLTFRSSFGIDYFYTIDKVFEQKTTEGYTNQTVNGLYLNNLWGNVWTFTNTLNYSKTLGNHTFKILLGTESINDFNQNIAASREEFSFEQVESYQVLDAGTLNRDNSGSYSRSTLASLFGRLDYSYADKYIINGTLRRDGSSKFGKNNRWGYFPAAAIGWRISAEDFMQNMRWLTDMKLRASWGIIGNQTGLDAENQFSTFTSTDSESYPLAGTNTSYTPSATIVRLGNPDARWEKSVTTNIGIDASMLAGRIAVTADYFIKKIEDLLVTNQPPSTSPSATQPSINAGNMVNKGVDMSVTNRGRILGNLNYEVSLNFTKYNNEVTKVLDNPNATLQGGNTRLGNVTLTKPGNPISMFYGYEIEGFFNSQQEVDDYIAAGYNNTWNPPAVGRWKIKDINDDKVINDLDRTFLGSPHPDYQMGMNLSLAYMNFDLSAFLFFNKGGDIANIERFFVDFNTFALQRSARMLYDSWTPENTDAMLPKLDINDTYSNRYFTDYFIEDGTYLRLRNLQLGYTLPQDMLNRFRMNNLRLYVQFQNLFTLTKFSGLDPGISISGNDLSMGVVGDQNATGTPVPKQVVFGLNLGF